MNYAELGSSFMQVGGECPEGWIIMKEPRPEGDNSTDYTAQADGSWAVTQETLRSKAAVFESVWRDVELPVAKDNVTAIQFEDPDALPGTEAEWKAYWIALRNWKDGNPDYPDLTKRPPRPS
ncbi:hypothetical protein KJF94_07285 [Pseudomonas hormoni]|uniref:Phage tail protein n=1 Tax=Pseudomonas hormoni TaxID=3093767 RepID=A0ABX8F2Q0_9PSED|nr:hypothetical protein [Pseudomonas hormoni]QVW25369.1 hypothetical protein KJF94_07285 [Pseudomonas hormoni]